MKNSISILVVLISLISCKTPEIDPTKADLNTIALYDYDNTPITANDITKQWNTRIQTNEEINAKITSLEITHLTDQKTNKKELVLIGNTTKNNVKTATKLTPFKNGFKVNEISVTCNSCDNGLNIKLNSGNYNCIGKRDGIHSCTKIVTLRGV